MKDDKLQDLLNDLAEHTSEPARAGLGEQIKQQIPHQLGGHRAALDAINIVIDLRISKLAAVAAIVLTVVLWVHFFGGPNLTRGIYQDSKVLAKHWMGIDDTESKMLAGLAGQRSEVVSYGNEAVGKNSVTMHWRLAGGNYVVVFGDNRAETVSADELIKLLAERLQEKKD